MLKHIIYTLFILITLVGNAQQSIDDVLNSIVENNKKISSSAKYVEANSFQFHSGITPDNPNLSADYMIGRPVSGGNQFDFLFTQGFDFPTVYSNKKQLADNKTLSLTYTHEELKQEVLFSAYNTCLELIALNKQKDIIQDRLLGSAELLKKYQDKYESGQIGLLQLNKVKVQHLGLKADLEMVNRTIDAQNKELLALNGDGAIEFNVSQYPLASDLPALEVLIESISNGDYRLKWLTSQNDVMQSQLDLSKSMTLPNFELGYHYQSVLGQTFNGAHFGMSIPLWQHKNTVKAAKAFREVNQYQIEQHKTEHHAHVETKYNEYLSLKQTLEEFNQVLSSINTKEILDKSLALGEIDLMTYLLEIDYFYNLQDKYLTIEKEYQLKISELTKYKL